MIDQIDKLIDEIDGAAYLRDIIRFSPEVDPREREYFISSKYKIYSIYLRKFENLIECELYY